MKNLAFLFSFLFIPALVLGQPYSYNFNTVPVSEENGDSILTQQVSVSTSAPTLLTSTMTYRALRTTTVHNTGAFIVYIGTAAAGTGLSSTGFDLTPSTGPAASYRTNNSAWLYGLATGGAAIKVTVIEEYNSVP